MDQPDDVLSAQRAKVADLQRQLEIAQSELRGMETVARAFGSIAAFHSKHAVLEGRRRLAVGAAGERPKGTAGRQPGAISREWRETLGALIDRSFPAEEVSKVVEMLHGRTVRTAEVRRIFERYQEHGFIKPDINDQYRVTQLAIDKFGLDKSNENAPSSSAFHNVLGGADTAEQP